MSSRDNTLHINRSGWWVERPHATGSDIGPACAMRGTAPMDADMLRDLNENILPYYRRAGFRIHDTRPPTQDAKP